MNSKSEQLKEPTVEEAVRLEALEIFRRSAGFQIMFVLHSGLEISRAIDHLCVSAERLSMALCEEKHRAIIATGTDLLKAFEKAVIYAPNIKAAAGAFRAAVTPKGESQL